MAWGATDFGEEHHPTNSTEPWCLQIDPCLKDRFLSVDFTNNSYTLTRNPLCQGVDPDVYYQTNNSNMTFLRQKVLVTVHSILPGRQLVALKSTIILRFWKAKFPAYLRLALCPEQLLWLSLSGCWSLLGLFPGESSCSSRVSHRWCACRSSISSSAYWGMNWCRLVSN